MTDYLDDYGPERTCISLMLESVYGPSAPKLLARRTQNLCPAVIEISGTPLTREDGLRLRDWLTRELEKR